MYVCSCFGITEQQVRQHADDGRCTPRQIASACKAGTDCGSCVKRIQNLLGRGADHSRGGGGAQRFAAMLETAPLRVAAVPAEVQAAGPPPAQAA